jgi:hypothetical protein
VIDNLRAAVSRADWFDPELCPKVRSFAEHYGLAILPTKPYTPRHKGKIERGIGYVKGNALKGRTFPSLLEQNLHLLAWETSVADTRIHGTTRRQVKEVVEQAEKPALMPMPASRFDLFTEALRSVNRDGHVQVAGAYYSVPAEFLGQRLWARWDGRTVRLLDQKMRPVAVHVQRPPGAFSTQAVHILPEKISGIERGTSWLLRRVEYIGPHATQWAQSMLQNRGIEGVRVLMGLQSLTNKHSRHDLEQACRIAHSHGAYRLRSLRQLIEHKNPPTIQESFEFIQEHPIIRDLGDYQQFVREVGEFIERFLLHVAEYYRDPDGTPSRHVDNFTVAMKFLNRIYGTTPLLAKTVIALGGVLKESNSGTRSYFRNLRVNPNRDL